MRSVLETAFGKLAACGLCLLMLAAATFAQDDIGAKDGRIFELSVEHVDLQQPIQVIPDLPFFPFVTGERDPSIAVIGYRPDVADPAAIYANLNTSAFSQVIYPNGGQSGGITRLVADDLTLTGTAPHNLGSFTWLVCSTNTGTVTVRSRIRFYADNAGTPGALIAGYDLPAFVPLTNTICQPIAVRLTPELQVTISTNKIWAGITFDRAGGASITEAQLNNIGGAFFNPPEAGSSADLFFRTSTAGDFFSSNPPGAVMNVPGNPVDNFGWDIRRRVKLNPITRTDTNPRTAGTTARWTVTLNTSDPADATQLTGLVPARFSLVTTGTVSGTITSVTPNGSGNNSWTVNANLGAGAGTVGLNLIDNQTNLSTGIANAFPVVGEVYNVVSGATPTPTPTPIATPTPTPSPSPTTSPTPASTPWPQTPINPTDAQLGDLFGSAVAISGNTAIVGASGDDDRGSNSGSAYIYVRNGSAWQQQAKITADDGQLGDTFGYAVAIAGDSVIVGAWADDDNGANAGSAYIFVRNGTTWTQQAKLTASNGAADNRFGNSVAIHGDTAVVGTVFGDSSITDSGAAYVYVRSGTTWMQQQRIAPADVAASDRFGFSVGVIGDTVVLGSPFDDHNGADSGSAYIFTRSAGVWAQQQKLVPADGANSDQFGWSVAISGETVIIGAYTDDTPTANAGSAYVYTRTGSTWNQQQRLIPSDAETNDRFGSSVAIDGDRAIVGAPEEDELGSNAGAAYLFARNGVTWNQLQKMTAAGGSGVDRFGQAVAIAGGTAFVAAPNDDTAGGTDAGSVVVFTEPVTLVQIAGRVTTPSGSALRNVAVSLFDSQSVRRGTAFTSSFGNYSFANVPAGTYTITVANKRYRFAPRTMQVGQDMPNLDLVGLE